MSRSWLYAIPLTILLIVLTVYFTAPGWHTTTYIASGLSVAAAALVAVMIVNKRRKIVPVDVVIPKLVATPKPPQPIAKVVLVDTDDY